MKRNNWAPKTRKTVYVKLSYDCAVAAKLSLQYYVPILDAANGSYWINSELRAGIHEGVAQLSFYEGTVRSLKDKVNNLETQKESLEAQVKLLIEKLQKVSEALN